MHYEYGRLDVHYVVLLRVVEEPVVEESELGVAGRDLVGAGGEQPAYHGPPAHQKVKCEAELTSDNYLGMMSEQRSSFGG